MNQQSKLPVQQFTTKQGIPPCIRSRMGLYDNSTYKGAESVEQDQTASMCSLILLYTLRKRTSLVENSRRNIKHLRFQNPLLQDG